PPVPGSAAASGAVVKTSAPAAAPVVALPPMPHAPLADAPAPTPAAVSIPASADAPMTTGAAVAAADATVAPNAAQGATDAGAAQGTRGGGPRGGAGPPPVKQIDPAGEPAAKAPTKGHLLPPFLRRHKKPKADDPAPVSTDQPK